MAFMEVGWEGEGVYGAAWLEEAVCRDNYYNWFKRFIIFASIDPTIPST